MEVKPLKTFALEVTYEASDEFFVNDDVCKKNQKQPLSSRFAQ